MQLNRFWKQITNDKSKKPEIVFIENIESRRRYILIPSAGLYIHTTEYKKQWKRDKILSVRIYYRMRGYAAEHTLTSNSQNKFTLIYNLSLFIYSYTQLLLVFLILHNQKNFVLSRTMAEWRLKKNKFLEFSQGFPTVASALACVYSTIYYIRVE